MPNLFTPLSLKGVTLRNRIAVSPMCQYSSQDGMPEDWHLVHLGSRAVGGAGLVIAEATAVSPEGRISPQDTGIWSDAHVEPFARIARFLLKQGAIPGIQLAHAGRKGSASRPWEGDGHLKERDGGWSTIAPSAIAFGGNLDKIPEAMNDFDIQRTQRAFVDAASRSLAAGMQWLELHFAHGYLAHQFYSPLSNHRSDSYGGTFENRIRFLLETASAVRKVWPDRYPLTARLSVTDWIAGGVTMEESIELARQLRELGVDLIDVSHGFVTPDVSHIPWGPGFMIPFAKRIREEARVATAAGWMITEAKQADQIIRQGDADLVLLARELLRDPYWPYHAAVELEDGIADHLLPIPYARAAKPSSK